MSKILRVSSVYMSFMESLYLQTQILMGSGFGA